MSKTREILQINSENLKTSFSHGYKSWDSLERWIHLPVFGFTNLGDEWVSLCYWWWSSTERAAARGWEQTNLAELWSVPRPRLAEMAIEIWVMCQLGARQADALSFFFENPSSAFSGWIFLFFPFFPQLPSPRCSCSTYLRLVLDWT